MEGMSDKGKNELGAFDYYRMGLLEGNIERLAPKLRESFRSQALALVNRPHKPDSYAKATRRS